MLSDWAEASHNCTMCITFIGNTKKKKRAKPNKIKQKNTSKQTETKKSTKTAIKKTDILNKIN